MAVAIAADCLAETSAIGVGGESWTREPVADSNCFGKGCSPDNAACERFFGRLKNKHFYPQSWMSATIEHRILPLGW